MASVNPTLPAAASAVARLGFSFSIVLSLALQSGRWEQSMQRHLVTMAEQAAQAVLLQSQATAASTRAAQLTAQATTNAEQAAQWQAQGEESLAQSEADATLARADATTADEWAAQVAQEEARVETDWEQAAADELVVEKEVAEATSDASLAARKGFQAEQDEVVVGACNLVPVLDVVCDVVGGVAAVGLESVAAREAVKAAGEYTAAVAAQSRLEALTLEATQSQAQAARDGELALESRATAAEVSAKAQQELVQGQADEAIAQERWDESVAEEDGAEQQEAEAGVEEKASADVMKTSLQHGAWACWDAMRAGLCALMVLLFFTLRLLGSYIFPALGYACSAVLPDHGNVSRCKTVPSPWPTATVVSHIFHHATILALVGGTFFGDYLATLDQLNLRSRGGILLEMTSLAAVIQCVFLQLLPHALFRNKDTVPSWHEHAWRGGLLMVRSFLWLWPLLVMEVLLLQVNLGSRFFASADVLCHWYLWALLGCTVLIHYALLATPKVDESKPILPSTTAGDDDEQAKIRLMFDSREKTEDTAYGTFNESTALIDHDTRCDQIKSTSIVSKISFWELLGRDLKRLGFPFELLIVSSMVALL